MAPKRKRNADSLICNIDELVGMPRKQILGLLKKIRDGKIDTTHGVCADNIDADRHFRFESVSMSQTFELDPEKAKRGDIQFLVEVADPGLLIQHVLSESSTLAQEYVDALGIHPGTRERPWRLIIGFDEYVPGSQFNFENSKKVMALYFTFSEVFSHKNASWFAPFIVRVRLAHKVQGGIPAIMAWFLKRMLWGPHGLSSAGAVFTTAGRHYTFFAELANLISDADGHRLVLGWRGAGSFKPCPRHWNVWRKGSDLAGRIEGAVEITCADASKMHVATKEEFEDACDIVAEGCRRWQDGRITKTMYEVVRNMNGMNWIAESLAYDLEVRAKTNIHKAITIDWVHSFLQDGVVTVEAWLVLDAHGHGEQDGRAAIERFFSARVEFSAFLPKQRGWAVSRFQ